MFCNLHFAGKINFCVHVKTFEMFDVWRLHASAIMVSWAGDSSLWRFSPNIPYRSRVGVGAFIHATARHLRLPFPSAGNCGFEYSCTVFQYAALQQWSSWEVSRCHLHDVSYESSALLFCQIWQCTIVHIQAMRFCFVPLYLAWI